MIPILEIIRQALITPPSRTIFGELLAFTYAQKIYEFKVQQRIDNVAIVEQS